MLPHAVDGADGRNGSDGHERERPPDAAEPRPMSSAIAIARESPSQLLGPANRHTDIIGGNQLVPKAMIDGPYAAGLSDQLIRRDAPADEAQSA